MLKNASFYGKFAFIAVFMLFLSVSSTLGQDGFDDEYTTEFSYGINFNTNAGTIGGLTLKYARLYRPKLFVTIGLEVVHVKHDKEQRYRNARSSDAYILGKVNYFFPIRPQIGFDYVLFKKAPDEGIQINAVGAIGPSIGIQKPYFIFYDFGNDDVRLEPFSPSRHRDLSRIMGSGGYLQGFDQAEIIGGGHIKAGLSFEFGKLNEDVVGMELGFTYEAFYKDPIIMASEFDFNRKQFTAAYLTLYYGRKR